MGDKEIVTTEAIESPRTVTQDMIIEWLDATGKTKGLTEGETKQFIEIARSFALNPFKREIYVTVFNKNDPEKRQLSIVIGYEVYLKRAERIRSLDGWKCWTEGAVPNMKAVVQIYRKDRQFPFQWEVPYSEALQTDKYGKPNRFWTKMPGHMLKKVCISQGFRLCFPDDLGGIPYTDAEMPPHEYADFETVPTQADDTASVAQPYPTPEPPEMEGRVPQDIPSCPACNNNDAVMTSKWPKPGSTHYCKACKKQFEPEKTEPELQQTDIF